MSPPAPPWARSNSTIALAESVVRTRAGGYSSACEEGFRTAVTFTAACMIEKSYFPEQVRTERSPYEQLNAELEVIMTGLLACVESAGGGSTDPTGAPAPMAYDFRTPSVVGGCCGDHPYIGNINHPCD